MTLEEWVERHRLEGHHPHAVPTHDNPEKWECYCGTVWRILTRDQIRMKFAHRRATAERRGARLPRRSSAAYTRSFSRRPNNSAEQPGNQHFWSWTSRWPAYLR